MILKYVPSILNFVRVFIINWCWIFSNAFFCIYWNDHVIYVFPFINMMYHIVWFAYVELFLWPWDESDFVVTWSFLCVVGFDLLIFCWEVLHLYSSKFMACNSFLVMSLSGYGIRVTSWLWSIPSYSVFWKTLRRISISSSL